MKSTIILGGHGKVALLTERLLTDNGIPSSAIIRQTEQRPTVEAAGVSPVVLNLEDASLDEMTQAFVGVQTMVWAAGAGGGSSKRTYAVDRDAAIRSMDAALSAHVQRYIMVSYWNATHGYDRIAQTDSFYAYARAKADAGLPPARITVALDYSWADETDQRDSHGGGLHWVAWTGAQASTMPRPGGMWHKPLWPSCGTPQALAKPSISMTGTPPSKRQCTAPDA